MSITTTTTTTTTNTNANTTTSRRQQAAAAAAAVAAGAAAAAAAAATRCQNQLEKLTLQDSDPGQCCDPAGPAGIVPGSKTQTKPGAQKKFFF